ncbi:hypothetical protein PPERSA_02702 [Pseudocohnilembus persalinus]|uniref:Calcium uniporter protein C-terminal domain-containing protein n=1 Tax=Pseudocohnilembus persalinus TaxID=266149 RepID=A0A0V0R5P6_PSEPJ|nr:hypothetical protein PPERSA_02702 [Pseudocohnilembus persalinus]|eukprot:KRX09830.1 hypothetical protein PPERSA_02702 [Pseudocohnilembus persalinus]
MNKLKFLTNHFLKNNNKTHKNITKLQKNLYKFSTQEKYGSEKLKGVCVLNEDDSGNLMYVTIKNTPFIMQLSQTIMEFQQIQAQKSRIYPITFYDAHTNQEYASTTPFQFIINKDFLMHIRDEIYYIYAKNSFVQPSIDLQNYQKFKQFYNIHFTTQQNLTQIDIEQKFIRNVLEHLESLQSKQISTSQLQIIIQNELYQQAVQRKKKVSQINEILDLLYLEKKNLIEEEKEIKVKAQKKSKSAYNKLLSFYLVQAFMLQYGTYFLYSWDIIEPITCLCTTLDMGLAYYYWLRFERDFNWKDVWARKQNKLEKQIKNKQQFPTDRMEDVNNLIQTFEAKKQILSVHQEEVFKGIQNDL